MSEDLSTDCRKTAARCRTQDVGKLQVIWLVHLFKQNTRWMISHKLAHFCMVSCVLLLDDKQCSVQILSLATHDDHFCPFSELQKYSVRNKNTCFQNTYSRDEILVTMREQSTLWYCTCSTGSHGKDSISLITDQNRRLCSVKIPINYAKRHREIDLGPVKVILSHCSLPGGINNRMVWDRYHRLCFAHLYNKKNEVQFVLSTITTYWIVMTSGPIETSRMFELLSSYFACCSPMIFPTHKMLPWFSFTKATEPSWCTMTSKPRA